MVGLAACSWAVSEMIVRPEQRDITTPTSTVRGKRIVLLLWIERRPYLKHR